MVEFVREVEVQVMIDTNKQARTFTFSSLRAASIALRRAAAAPSLDDTLHLLSQAGHDEA